MRLQTLKIITFGGFLVYLGRLIKTATQKLIGKLIKLKVVMIICAGLSIIAYALAVLSPLPWLSLVACGLCGFAVGIMWPGTLSMASKTLGGTTAMFALLAVFGDIGCTVGPTLVGMVSAAFNDDLKKGLLCVTIFPVIMIIGNVLLGKKKNVED